MEEHYKKEGKYSYFEAGEGTPIVILHGLMGGLSNFNGVANYFSNKGYKIIIPDLPIYTQSLLRTNVKAFAKYVKDFIAFKGEQGAKDAGKMRAEGKEYIVKDGDVMNFLFSS